MAPRPRSRKNQKLPEYVYLKKGRYVLVEYNPETRKQTEKRLCSGEATLAQVWAVYEKMTIPAGGRTKTFRWLSKQYQDSLMFLKKAASTQQDYRGYHRRICSKMLEDGRYFGDIPLKNWTIPTVRKYLDQREKEDACIGGNREKSYISLVFSWAIERDLGGVTINPAKGVRRNEERARTRYVTDAEFEAAKSELSGYLPIIMELAYLLRARLSEVLDLTRDDVLDEGIYLHRRKGSRDAITRWSPALKSAVDAAKILRINLFGKHLIQGRSGDRLSESTVQTACGRFMRKKWQGERFTIHDLKAKGITDTPGDKQRAGGHKDPRMVHVYDRKPIDIEPTK